MEQVSSACQMSHLQTQNRWRAYAALWRLWQRTPHVLFETSTKGELIDHLKVICQTGLWLVCICYLNCWKHCVCTCCACGCSICVNCAWQARMTVGVSWIFILMRILLFTVRFIWYWVEFEAGHQLLAYFKIWVLSLALFFIGGSTWWLVLSLVSSKGFCSFACNTLATVQGRKWIWIFRVHGGWG